MIKNSKNIKKIVKKHIKNDKKRVKTSKKV